MKIETIKEHLRKSVSKIEKLVQRNPNLPILSCLLFETKNNTLVIKATNLDIGAEITLPVKTITPGTVAVPATIINQLLNNLPYDDKVTLEVDKDILIVSTDNSTTRIKTIPFDEFPNIPHHTNTKSITLESGTLLQGFKSVWYSASNSNIKPELSSVYVNPEETTLTFAATDSFRLAEKKIHIKKQNLEESVLIPFKNIIEIMPFLEDSDDGVVIYLDENQIAFEIGQTYITSRVVDGAFPNYKQIIPKEKTTEVTVLKDDLITIIKTAHIFSDKFNQIKLSINPIKKEFTINTTNIVIGETTQSIPATIVGEEIIASFNYKYITDCFQAINGDSVTLLFNGVSKPLIIKDTHDTSFMYLVMPINK